MLIILDVISTDEMIILPMGLVSFEGPSGPFEI